jgi:hypothetical protein
MDAGTILKTDALGFPNHGADFKKCPAAFPRRPAEITQSGFSAWLVGCIYAADTNTNVLPSMHVVGCCAICYAAFTSSYMKKLRVPLVVLGGLICLFALLVFALLLLTGLPLRSIPSLWRRRKTPEQVRALVKEKMTPRLSRRAEEDAFARHMPIEKVSVTPACVQTCPPSALMFGDINNPDDPITKLLRNNKRAFQLLEELGTEPAVVYLKGGDSYVNE